MVQPTQCVVALVWHLSYVNDNVVATARAERSEETRFGKEGEGGSECAHGVGQPERVSWLHHSEGSRVGPKLDLCHKIGLLPHTHTRTHTRTVN
jgi:hypothetical protein